MPYRDDLTAARARIAELERQLKEKSTITEPQSAPPKRWPVFRQFARILGNDLKIASAIVGGAAAVVYFMLCFLYYLGPNHKPDNLDRWMSLWPAWVRVLGVCSPVLVAIVVYTGVTWTKAVQEVDKK